MSRFSSMRMVPYSAAQIFHIAGDVAAYDKFLPLVDRSVVTNLSAEPDGRRSFAAELHFSHRKLGISDTLRSHVIVDPRTCTVKAASYEGPVKSLTTEWRIRARGHAGAEIYFSVDYTLKSRSLQFLLSGMFDYMVRRIMTAFEDRARHLYGAPIAA